MNTGRKNGGIFYTHERKFPNRIFYLNLSYFIPNTIPQKSKDKKNII